MINLAAVKAHLRVVHSDDDALLTRLLASAQAECLKFTNETTMPVGDDIDTGVILMVQADYDGDPAKRNAFRDAALNLWMPYRVNLGV